MRNLAREIQHAIRLHWKDSRYAAMIVLTLAVSIGANTAVFTVVHSVLLQPLPIPRADDLMLFTVLPNRRLASLKPGGKRVESFDRAFPVFGRWVSPEGRADTPETTSRYGTRR